MLAGGAQRRLLIVDDEPLVRQTLAYVFQNDYDVVAVGSGREAIEASSHGTFPVVLLDLCMEGLSGIETLQKLKEIHENQNIIILTAYQSTESAISALNLGAFNYVTKPFERSHLKRIVSHGFEVYEQELVRELDMRHRLMEVHDSFFRMLCHEFNTPLNAILGFSELLEEGRSDPEFSTWVDHIKDSGKQLHAILMEFLDYVAAAHLAEAGVDRPFVPRSVLEPLAQDMGVRGITVRLGAGMDYPVSGAVDALRLICKKLLRIAARRSRDIRLSTFLQKKDGLHLLVVVGGTGIHETDLSEADVVRMFDSFPFLRGAGSSNLMNLNLEFATCRRIADYAHATINGRFDAAGEMELSACLPVALK